MKAKEREGVEIEGGEGGWAGKDGGGTGEELESCWQTGYHRRI